MIFLYICVFYIMCILYICVSLCDNNIFFMLYCILKKLYMCVKTFITSFTKYFSNFPDPSFYILPSTIHIVVAILIQSMAIFVRNLVTVILEWVRFPIGIQYIINGNKLRYPIMFKILKLLEEILLHNIQRYLV